MTEFSTSRNRDAWSAIRGFVYQVDLSIERWLDLKSGEFLELERGEDIDLVSQALTGLQTDEQRLLEQVKHLEQNVTLRTPASAGALACAVEHRASNPALKLTFRFATTAHPGIEQSSPLGRKSGIGVWESIRQTKLEGNALTTALEGLRQILKTIKKPEDFPDTTWEAFQKFLKSSNDKVLAEFIHNFEWSTGQPAAAQFSQRIQQLLLQRGLAKDATEAGEMYHRLFLHVFKLLTKPGAKRLTSDDLNQQLALPTLSETDHAQLARLRVGFTHLEQRVNIHDQVLGALTSKFDSLAAEQGIISTITSGNAPPMLEVPALVEKATLRNSTVENFVARLNDSTWLAIHGPALSGKTQIAVLTVRALKRDANWIRFRGLNSAACCRLLDAAMAALADATPTADRTEFFGDVCRDLGSDAVLVLDDLPKISNGDELSERLLILAHACTEHGVKLITISADPLPEALKSQLSGGLLHATAMPPISEEETREILATHGAPSDILDKGLPGFVCALGNQHPGLICAIASYLHRKSWKFSEGHLQELFQQVHAENLNDETLERLTSTVQDAETRQFLYRLNLIRSDFTLNDAVALANIPTQIDRPRERLHALLGLWIQRDGIEQMRVSPLIKALGSEDLNSDTKKACNLLLGERLTSRQEISHLEALQALIYFQEAGEHNRAALVFGQILVAMLHQDFSAQLDIVLSVWSDQPLPQQIDLVLKIYIRSLQIAAYGNAGRDISYLAEDLGKLMLEVDEVDSWALLIPAALATPAMVEHNPTEAFSLLLRCVNQSKDFHFPGGEAVTFPEGFTVETLIWMPILKVTTADQICEWMAFVGKLSPEQKRRAMTGQLAEAGVMALSGRLLSAEFLKAPDQQNWEAIHHLLIEFADTAYSLELELLWAALIRAQMMVIVDFQKNLEGALILAETALQKASEDPNVRFLIIEFVGEKLVDAGRMPEGINWLTRAFATDTKMYANVRCSALIYMSLAFGTTNADQATKYAEDAVSLAEIAEDIPKTDLVRAMGELTISRWIQGSDVHVLFEKWDATAEALFACTQRESEEWKDLFVVFGHITGYFSHLALTGEPLEQDGLGEHYSPPARGMLFRQVSGRAAFYSAEREIMLISQMAIYAVAASQPGRARQWTLRGLKLAQTGSESMALVSLHLNNIAYLLEEARFVDVLEAAHQSSMVLVASSIQAAAPSNAQGAKVDYRTALGPKTSASWQRVERSTFNFGIIPSVLHLCTIALTDRSKAKSEADNLARVCRETAEDSPIPNLWQTTADLLEQAFQEATNSADFLRRGRDLSTSNEDDLALIAWLLASVIPDVTLADALVAHCSFLALSERSIRSVSAVEKNIVRPFFWNYWCEKFDRMRFSFRNPGGIDSRLKEARKSVGDNLKELVRIMVEGIGLKLPAALAAWLNR